MQAPLKTENEQRRLEALRELNLLDTTPEERFDRLTRLARAMFNVPIALISLVDEDRQWFKSRQGLDVSETSRDISFCGHAIHTQAIFHIPDALVDSRFSDNPLVRGFPYIRLYVGAPLTTNNGCRVGTLCIIDDKPRQLTEQELLSLRDLADCVENEMNQNALQMLARSLKDQEEHLVAVVDAVVDGIITIDDRGRVMQVNRAAERMFGYAGAELVGRNVSMLMNERDAHRHDHYIGEYLQSHDPKIIGKGRQVEGRRKDGTLFPIELTVAEMVYGGRRSFVGVTRDVTEREQTIVRLREMQTRLDRAIAGTSDGLWDWDVGLERAWFAPRFKALIGYADDEMDNTFDAWASRFHPDDSEPTMAALQAHLRDRKPFDVEYRLKTKAGEYRWYRARGQAVRNESGEPLLMSGSLMDIDDRKQAEAAMASYAMALERLHSVTARTDMDFDTKVYELLALGREIFRLPLAIISRIEGDTYTVLYPLGPQGAPPPGTQFALGETYCAHTLAAGRAVGFHHAGQSSINTHPCYQKFGLEAYLGAPLVVGGRSFGTLNFSSIEPRPTPFSDSDYSIINLFAQWIGNEIERNETDQQLGKVTALRQAILDSANFSIISTEVDGTITTFNHGAERMLGYGADEVIGQVTPVIIHDEQEIAERAQVLEQELGTAIAPGFEVFVAKARRGIADEREWTYIGKHGRRLSVLLSVTAVCNNAGDIIGFLGIASDITERKRAEKALLVAKEQAERNNKMKSEFINMMSHELRTPLTVILGYLPMLKNPDKLPSQAMIADMASDMQLSGDHLLHLINDLLDLSKIEAGKLDLKCDRISLGEVVDSVLDGFRLKAQAKGLALIKKIGVDEIYADPVRLRQILFNLVGNAVKFTHEGAITVASDAVGDGVAVSVLDTGVGIPANDLPEIFDKFRQVDSSSTRKAGGTGLGLAITRRLVELHGGTVNVRSQEGVGTEFTLYFLRGMD